MKIGFLTTSHDSTDSTTSGDTTHNQTTPQLVHSLEWIATTIKGLTVEHDKHTYITTSLFMFGDFYDCPINKKTNIKNTNLVH